MAVPYTFASLPNGTAIPLSYLDANFSYLSTSPTFSGNVTVSGTLTVVGSANFSNTLGVTGAVTISNTLGVTGAATFGTQQTTQGSIILANTAAGAYATTIKSSNSASAAWTLTLPTTAGTNGYILTTNGSGVSSWTNPTALGIDLDVGGTAITAGTSGRILYDNAGVLGETSSLTISPTSNKINIVSAPFGLSGNISSTAWTTNGIRYQNSPATLTDTSSSGVVANAYTDFFGANTIAASNVTTFTNYYTMYLGTPAAGTNVTITNPYSLGTSGNANIGGTITTSGIVGVTNASNATAGNVGEVISGKVLAASAISLTTATPANVVSISLTAGDWDVIGNVAFVAAGTTTVSAVAAGMNTTSATFVTDSSDNGFPYTNIAATLTTGSTNRLSISKWRVNVNSTTTVYLIAQASFATSTMTAYGAIVARRIR